MTTTVPPTAGFPIHAGTKILGIETSCDETAAAVVDDTGDAWRLRSNVVASQVDIHREWGGVVPELASRQHVRDICGVVERALADAGVGWSDLHGIAVTEGPGLVGSLLGTREAAMQQVEKLRTAVTMRGGNCDSNNGNIHRQKANHQARPEFTAHDFSFS